MAKNIEKFKAVLASHKLPNHLNYTELNEKEQEALAIMLIINGTLRLMVAKSDENNETHFPSEFAIESPGI